MAKTTVFVIFMVVLVLGMMMMESQAQEYCHENIVEPGICEATQCAADCTAKWGRLQGVGKCIQGTRSCLCTYNCKN